MTPEKSREISELESDINTLKNIIFQTNQDLQYIRKSKDSTKEILMQKLFSVNPLFGVKVSRTITFKVNLEDIKNQKFNSLKITKAKLKVLEERYAKL